MSQFWDWRQILEIDAGDCAYDGDGKLTLNFAYVQHWLVSWRINTPTTNRLSSPYVRHIIRLAVIYQNIARRKLVRESGVLTFGPAHDDAWYFSNGEQETDITRMPQLAWTATLCSWTCRSIYHKMARANLHALQKDFDRLYDFVQLLLLVSLMEEMSRTLRLCCRGDNHQVYNWDLSQPNSRYLCTSTRASAPKKSTRGRCSRVSGRTGIQCFGHGRSRHKCGNHVIQVLRVGRPQLWHRCSTLDQIDGILNRHTSRSLKVKN